MKFKNKAIFLDRDGVLIKDVGYLNDIKQVVFLKKTFQTLRLAKKKGFKLIVITNQSVVGRGIITKAKLNKIHSFILKKFKSKKILIKKIYFCPHHPKFGINRYKIKCKCRKPNNLLIERAIKKYRISRENSFFIGDKISDKLAAKKSKIKFRFRSKKNFYSQIKNLIIE